MFDYNIKSNKLTYVSAYSLNGAKNIFNNLIQENHAILNELNIKSEIFDEIYNLLLERINR